MHGQCQTVVTRFRPVPLTWHYCHSLEGRTHLLPLLNRKATNMSAQMLGEGTNPQQDEDQESGWLQATRSERRRRRCSTPPPLPFPQLLPCQWVLLPTFGCAVSSIAIIDALVLNAAVVIFIYQHDGS